MGLCLKEMGNKFWYKTPMKAHAVFYLLPIIFYLFIPFHLSAQTDTTFTLSPVSLEATTLQEAQASSDASSFKPDSLGQFATAGLTADAVLRQAEGLYIRNYGGHGGVRTLSVRGYAAPQTTVSLNGIPYASPQSGVVNLGNFYPEGYAGISLTRGGSGGKAGIAPLGGNVDFQLAPAGSSLNLKVGRGAYGEAMAGMQASLKRKRISAQGGLQLLEAEDNFPFNINGEQGTRAGADFSTTRLMAQLQYSDSTWEISWFGIGYQNKQGVPGPVLTGNVSNAFARIEEEDAFQALTIRRTDEHVNSWKPYSWNVDLAYHVNELQYLPATGLQRYLNQDFLGQVSMTHLGLRSRTQTVLQVQPAWLSGNNLAIGFQPVEAVKRTIWRAGISRQGSWQMRKHRLGHNLTTRLGHSPNNGLLPEGNLGLTWKLPKDKWEVFTHINAGLRLPAFNELYYFGYGNASLPPERVRGGDVGIWHQRKLGSWLATVKLSAFGNITVNKIVAIPVNPAVWSTRAIGRSRSLGTEASLEFLHKYARLYLNYTRQDVRDVTLEGKPYLPYTPPEILSYGIDQTWGQFSFGVHGHYSGWRFTLPVIEESAFEKTIIRL